MVPRDSAETLSVLAKDYPALAITGPRQSGKTTLARAVFGDRPYVSLENPDTLMYAESDPRGFLKRYREGAVFDEAQRCPSLFSYLQQIIDQGPSRPCRFVLIGSQQFGMMSKITQSLAGRIADIALLPFSYHEWYSPQAAPPDLAEVLFRGLYPPVLDRGLDARTWYGNYTRHYLERNVRQILNVGDLRTFGLFLRMCAARTGQLLNLSALASDCGIAVNTAKAWLSILEGSYIVFLLSPHFANFGKRLIKSPKLYFYDCGLVSYLLSVDNASALQTHAMRGPLFECYVLAEMKKLCAHRNLQAQLSFWRDRTGHEVDAVIERGGSLDGVEAKSGMTVTSDMLKSLLWWRGIAGKSAGRLHLIYGGDESFERQGVRALSWRRAGHIVS